MHPFKHLYSLSLVALRKPTFGRGLRWTMFKSRFNVPRPLTSNRKLPQRVYRGVRKRRYNTIQYNPILSNPKSNPNKQVLAIINRARSRSATEVILCTFSCAVASSRCARRPRYTAGTCAPTLPRTLQVPGAYVFCDASSGGTAPSSHTSRTSHALDPSPTVCPRPSST